MNREEFAAYFQKLRKDRGLQQKAIASALGISSQAVSRYEKGLSFPDIANALALCNIFKVSIDDFLAGKDRPFEADYELIPLKFGAYIAFLRKKKGWTQKDLSRRLNGVTPQAVSRWECGLGLPDPFLLPLLAKVLGRNVDELFHYGKGDPEFEGKMRRGLPPYAIALLSGGAALLVAASGLGLYFGLSAQGNEAPVYRIATFADLVEEASSLSDPEASFLLEGDIVYQPGTSFPKLEASIDGQGHAIRFLSAPLFESIGSEGRVANLALEVDFEEGGGAKASGALARVSEGTVDTVKVEGSLTSGASYVGALVGMNEGSIKNAQNECQVEGGMTVGGIVGFSGGTVSFSCNNAIVSSSLEEGTIGSIAGLGLTNAGLAANCTSVAGLDERNPSISDSLVDYSFPFLVTYENVDEVLSSYLNYDGSTQLYDGDGHLLSADPEIWTDNRGSWSKDGWKPALSLFLGK